MIWYGIDFDYEPKPWRGHRPDTTINNVFHNNPHYVDCMERLTWWILTGRLLYDRR